MKKVELTFLSKSINKFGIMSFNHAVTDYNYRLPTKQKDRLVSLVCSKHGDFIVSAKYHLRSKNGGCSECKREVDSDKLKRSYNALFESLGITLKSEILTYSGYVGFLCLTHGEFERRLSDVKRGGGCPSCAYLDIAFSKSQFMNACKRRSNIGLLYVIECFDDNERFIKVGITSESVKTRYSKSKIPYNYIVLNELYGNPEDIFKIERLIHKYMRRKFKYSPNKRFKGSINECYKLSD